ncbi:hypothetical protein HMPREF1982_02645 [Clostridiales bacterium oral taxon 876 str. F0540]|nr:hypothetical protein HMPREF1982_02645 [Clostridiales bacterium oral taxon 876 str. F0540]
MRVCKRKEFLLMLLLIVLGISSMFNLKVYAEENNKTQSIYYLNSNGIVNGTLFSNEDVLWPGRKISKEFYIANDNNFNCIIKNIVIDGELRNKNSVILNVEDIQYKEFMKNTFIKMYCDDKEIFSGNADSLIWINMPDETTINSYKKKKFVMEFYFDEAANKSAMDMKYILNMQTNFDATDSISTDIPSDISDMIEKGVLGTSLVQTGYFIDYNLLLISGALLTILGLALVLKKKLY